jgi:hypothetical protein
MDDQYTGHSNDLRLYHFETPATVYEKTNIGAAEPIEYLVNVCL